MTEGYRARINRVARAALVIGLLAVLFAPGALENPSDSAPQDVAAAVLAPTTADLATVAPVVERKFRTTVALATLLVVALLVGRGPRRLTGPVRTPWHRVDADPGAFRRRGPPLSLT